MGPIDPRPADGSFNSDRCRRYLTILLLAVVAGVAAWAAGESPLVRFRASREAVSMMGGQVIETSPRTRALASLRGTSAAFGILGGLLGLALGIAGTVPCRPTRRAWIPPALGLALGAIAGALPPWVVIPLSNRTEDLSGADLGRSMMIHTALWVAAGGVAGLAWGLGAGGRDRALKGLMGGAIGAIVGVVIYDLIGGLAFPLAGTGLPRSTTPTTRLLAYLLIALGTAAGTALSATDRRSN